jgi:integrase
LYDYAPDARLFSYSNSCFLKTVRKGCAASGAEKARRHDLRRSHASLLIEMGVPIHLVSERLGHEDTETTPRKYGHFYPNRHSNAAARLDNPIAGAAQN